VANPQQNSPKLSSELSQIIDTFRSANNYAIFVFNPEVYIQIARKAGESWLHCEAVSNTFLKFHRLGEPQIEKLLELGWKPPDKLSPNFFQVFDATDNSELIKVPQLIMNTSQQVYSISVLTNVEVKLNLE
jgi:hypothetical protein